MELPIFRLVNHINEVVVPNQVAIRVHEAHRRRGASQGGIEDVADPVEIRVLAFPENSINGQVTSIGVKTDSVNLANTIPVHIEIKNENRILRAGMSGKSRILAHRESLNAFLFRQFLRTIRMDLWF